VEHNRQRSNGIVFIASEAVLTAWSARTVPVSEIIGVSDADVVGAVQTIAHRQPHMVVLEEGFTSTQRGAALVGRLQADPDLRHIEIRFLSPERAAQISRGGVTVSLAALTHPVPFAYRIARRYARWRVNTEVKTQVNGQSVTLVDVSTNGAQLLSAVAVRPTQRVRILFEDSVRINAKVAWAAFEMHQPAPPRYRAGIEFVDADDHELHALFLRVGVPIATPTKT